MRSLATLAALSLCLAGLVAWGYAPASYDDGYITFRYADNLARGHGFVFNPGEPVLGTSAPGYALLLAGLRSALPFPGFDVATWGFALGILSLAALPILLHAGLTRPPAAPHPALASLVFAALALPCRWNVELLGGEGLPVLALAAGALVAALAGREALAGTLAGCATALRFDAALAVAAFGVAFWLSRRRLPWRFLGLAVLPPAAVVLWLLSAFGSALPSTLAGKRSEIPFAGAGYFRSEIDWLLRAFGGAGTLALAAMAVAGLFVLARIPSRHRLWAGACAAWLLAHEAFYRLAGVPFAPWYHLAAVNALLALGALGCGPWLTADAYRGWHGARRLALGAVALALIALLLPTAAFHAETWGRPPDPRIRVYRDAALALHARSPGASCVAAVEIGALAYFGDRPVLDLTGLVEPAVLAARREDRLADLVAARRPDYLLDNPNFHSSFLAPLVESGELDRDYRAVASFARPEYPFAIRLLERRPAAPR